MRVTPTTIPGVVAIEPRVHSDARGSFVEVWHAERYAEHGLGASFVQDNVSRSTKHVLRGLHVQEPFGQGKLIHVLEGEVYDVAVDVRLGSPTFGRWVSRTLSGENRHQLYLPPGVAHGFCVTSDSALLAYKCTELYRPDTEISIAWDDPALGIAWPVAAPILSPKDAAAPALDRSRDRLPRWPGGPT